MPALFGGSVPGSAGEEKIWQVVLLGGPPLKKLWSVRLSKERGVWRPKNSSHRGRNSDFALPPRLEFRLRSPTDGTPTSLQASNFAQKAHRRATAGPLPGHCRATAGPLPGHRCARKNVCQVCAFFWERQSGIPSRASGFQQKTIHMPRSSVGAPGHRRATAGVRMRADRVLASTRGYC